MKKFENEVVKLVNGIYQDLTAEDIETIRRALCRADKRGYERAKKELCGKCGLAISRGQITDFILVKEGKK